MLQTSRKRFSSQVEGLEMVEGDPAEWPDGPPSPVQKVLACWELSEQQVGTRALCQRGQTLKRRQKAYSLPCFGKYYNITAFAGLNKNESC